MFVQYSRKDFSNLKNQHNIMILIGNGFDISLIKEYNKKNITTSYSDFYDYINNNNLIKRRNEIICRMTEKKNSKIENWSDFENIVHEVIMSRSDYDTLEADLHEIQNMFVIFLNEVIDKDILLWLDKESNEKQLAIQSLSKFLGDLRNTESLPIILQRSSYHYDLYNFLLVNFNYTYLLDNYMFLDKKQFSPRKHYTIDTHFYFYPSPNFTIYPTCNERTVWSSYLVTNIIHPHGFQYIPRSIIFGTEFSSFDRTSQIRNFIKSYWAQNDIKYSKFFDATELFIIYGMSLGTTDSWWFNKIYEQLSKERAELIIYFYGKDNSEKSIKDKFMKSCVRGSCNQEDDERVLQRIHIVLFDRNDTYFLGFSKK